MQLTHDLRRSVLLPQSSPGVGDQAYGLMERMFPLCRSLTGDGVRATLDLIEEEIPITRTEIPSGTRIFDWVVPDEWNIRDAYIAAPDGTRVVDFRESSLHVVSYSEPVRATLPLAASSASAFTRFPTVRIWCRTAPPTTRARGASAFPTTS